MYTKYVQSFLLSCCAAAIFSSCNQTQPIAISEDNQLPVIDLSAQASTGLPKKDFKKNGIAIIHLKGKVRYFGLNILQSPPQPLPLTGIPDVHVWIAEYPATKLLNITTNSDGIWEVILIKPSCIDLNFSFAYEKDFYPENVEKMVFPSGIPAPWNTTKICSNVHTVQSVDITDLAVQMPDETFLYYAKTGLERGISAKIGTAYSMTNILVATVGKSWASIYDSRLPHGDSGAIVSLSPARATPLQGPIYFDETVTPNPAIPVTSIDGGVLFNSLTTGVYTMTAQKASFSYSTIKFNVEEDFNLYISSPPHSIQSSNSSGPGE